MVLLLLTMALFRVKVRMAACTSQALRRLLLSSARRSLASARAQERNKMSRASQVAPSCCAVNRHRPSRRAGKLPGIKLLTHEPSSERDRQGRQCPLGSELPGGPGCAGPRTTASAPPPCALGQSVVHTPPHPAFNRAPKSARQPRRACPATTPPPRVPCPPC